MRKKVVRHIIDDLESSSDDSDHSDDSDEEQIKDMKLMFLKETVFENEFFEGAILKTYSGWF